MSVSILSCPGKSGPKAVPHFFYFKLVFLTTSSFSTEFSKNSKKNKMSGKTTKPKDPAGQSQQHTNDHSLP